MVLNPSQAYPLSHLRKYLIFLTVSFLHKQLLQEHNMVTGEWEIRQGLWQSFVQTAASVKSTFCSTVHILPKVIEQILLHLTWAYFVLEPLSAIKPFMKFSEKVILFLSFLNILKPECNKSLISVRQEYYLKSCGNLLFAFNSSLVYRISVCINLNKNNFPRVVDKERRENWTRLDNTDDHPSQASTFFWLQTCVLAPQEKTEKQM